MSRSFHESNELHDLVSRLCDEALDVSEQARLNELLAGDAGAQAWYVEYMDLHATVRRKTRALSDEDFTLLEVQAALSAVALTPGEPGPEASLSPTFASHPDWIDRLRRSPRRFWAAAAAAIVVAAALLLSRQTGDGSQATAGAGQQAVAAAPAKLSGAVGARWAGAALELPEGHVFENKQRLELVEGLAEVTFRCGARMIIQGPAVLEIQGGDAARMSVGRIAVAATLAPDAMPFTIQTAAAQVAVREAEFGADIDVDGSVVTEVYRGRIDLQFSRRGDQPTTLQLAGGQGARVDARSHRVTPLARPYDLHFVRYLPQHELLVNLADIVAGGNGVRKAYHRGISVVDGALVDDYAAPAQGDGRYVRTPALDLVDGVFIPNGKLGSVQVDSIGRKFAEFPPTAGDCWGAAIMARRPREEKSLPFIRLEHHGDNYGYVNWLHIAGDAEELSPQGHGLIGMHSNCGLTFDLHALRAKHPNKQVVRFRAQVGNLESKPERYVADAWILVDGELRYRRREFSREDGPETIDVPLTDRDRFLVLAVTDCGGSTAYDWVAFGDPIIELAGASETSAGLASPQDKHTLSSITASGRGLSPRSGSWRLFTSTASSAGAPHSPVPLAVGCLAPQPH